MKISNFRQILYLVFGRNWANETHGTYLVKYKFLLLVQLQLSLRCGQGLTNGIFFYFSTQAGWGVTENWVMDGEEQDGR